MKTVNRQIGSTKKTVLETIVIARCNQTRLFLAGCWWVWGTIAEIGRFSADHIPGARQAGLGDA